MNDNFYVSDLIRSNRKETTMARYWPLIPYSDVLLDFCKREGIVFRDDVTADFTKKLENLIGGENTALFMRFLHLYDFNKAKLREISHLKDTEKYPVLADLLRLPGVRILRAELYCSSGVTLEVFAEKSAEEIQDMVRAYIERENRPEIVPLTKEVNCHREVAKMILHADGR